MSARPLLFALCHACWLLSIACGQASAQRQQAVLERDAQLLTGPRGTRAMQEEPAAPREPASSANQGASAPPVDPASVLRGLFGR
jgi:hypothetical protein